MTARSEILDAIAAVTTRSGRETFAPKDIIEELRRRGSQYPDTTIRTHIVSAMCVNAPDHHGIKYLDLERVGHGVYRVWRGPDAGGTRRGRPERKDIGSADTARSRVARPRLTRKQALVQRRIEELVGDFGHFVGVATRSHPFGHREELRSHRTTIEMRRTHATVGEAIADSSFVSQLHVTLGAWGIGRRGSGLAPVSALQEALLRERDRLCGLDGLKIEDDKTDASQLIQAVWTLVRDLEVVDNIAKIVAGTKTLHHLLPDLVVPMDRAWTGRFFEWTTADPQNRQEETFTRTYSHYIEIARVATPSHYVGTGWHTSQTKVLDNAVMGFCLDRRTEVTVR